MSIFFSTTFSTASSVVSFFLLSLPGIHKAGSPAPPLPWSFLPLSQRFYCTALHFTVLCCVILSCVVSGCAFLYIAFYFFYNFVTISLINSFPALCLLWLLFLANFVVLPHFYFSRGHAYFCIHGFFFLRLLNPLSFLRLFSLLSLIILVCVFWLICAVMPPLSSKLHASGLVCSL